MWTRTVAWGLLAGAACLAGGCSGKGSSGGSGGGSGSSSSSSGFVGPQAGETGSPCARNSECDSALCLAAGRCTRSCTNTPECPTAWVCDALQGAGRLCQCTPTLDETELCDGLDNNCNATVDENATCADGKVCQDGECRCPPERSCNGQCVDLTRDTAHCGRCNNPCGSGRTCTDGECVLDCGSQTPCGNTCVDTQTSTLHCGRCDNPCGAGGTCSQGACQCSGNTTPCAGGCVNTLTDAAHCGGCGRPCTGGGTCTNGQCTGGTTTLCAETCRFAGDNECDDGGAGSVTALCDLGSDCHDCGARTVGSSSGGSSSSSSSGAPAAMGQPCTANGQCADGTCLTELRDGWPGGYCTKSCQDQTTCGSTGFCSGDLGVCLRRCTGSGDCRSDYPCMDPAWSGTTTCTPYANGTGDVGAPCTTFRDCKGGSLGYCVTETRGWPGGYCTSECQGGNLVCNTGHCVQTSIDPGFCATDCTSAAQCRTGYSCRSANSDAELECVP
ncbi:MAG: hypothetical protein HY904_08135 [Deltaproteobacteria bacterium]|nr:hypothetical protein [Deltaproteobacteria bacterium]